MEAFCSTTALGFNYNLPPSYSLDSYRLSCAAVDLIYRILRRRLERLIALNVFAAYKHRRKRFVRTRAIHLSDLSSRSIVTFCFSVRLLSAQSPGLRYELANTLPLGLPATSSSDYDQDHDNDDALNSKNTLTN